MRIVTAQRMRDIEQRLGSELGLSEATLMETAGRAAAARALAMLAHTGGKRVIVVCGAGNNGADGYVTARALLNAGCEVLVWAVEPPKSALCKQQAAMMRAFAITVLESAPDWRSSDLVIDAVLGIGARQPLDETKQRAVAAINACGRDVLALDVPSGLCVGATKDVVQASSTIGFGAVKDTVTQLPGRAWAGTLVDADIGIPKAFFSAADGFWLDTAWASKHRARRAPPGESAAHKGKFGHVVVIGGAPGTSGAASLAGRAALAIGAGLCSVATPGGAQSSAAPSGSTGSPRASEFADEVMQVSLAALPEKANAFVVGPGLGRSTEASTALTQALADKRPLVLDADALNLLADRIESLTQRPGPTVLTPHPLEFTRCFGGDVESLQRDRITSARSAAARSRAVVVLKGANTVVAAPDGRWAVCSSGTRALAKGGTGDVLAGVIGGLLAQGFDAFVAACAAAFWHGRAGELAADKTSESSVLASDVIAHLGEARGA